MKCLLAECHADPNYTTEEGLAPLSLTHNTAVIRLLLQHGAVAANVYKEYLPRGSPTEAAKSNVSLFVIGDQGAGKSTLTKALTTERASIIRWTGRMKHVGGVKERTAGIESHTVHSSRIGRLTLYDLAGHREFHNSHDTVIRSSISLGIFLFDINLRAILSDLKQTISYWISFIQSQVYENSSSPVAKPCLLVVGRHADSDQSKTELAEKERSVQSLCADEKNIDYVGYITVDCRYCESPAMTQLRMLILATHDKLQEKVPKSNFLNHCFHVYLVSECGDKPGLQLKALNSTIKHSHFFSKEFLPQTVEDLHDACSILNNRGIVLYIQTQSLECSWIIIDKDTLLQEVNGSIFAPADFMEHKSLTRTGVVPFSKIKISFPQFNPQLIVDFLVHMEFCREIREDDLLKLVTQAHTEYGKERHFLFPALTQQSPPHDLWQPQPDQYSCCWVLRCLDHHYLSPRFHQVLLLRLAFEHSEAVEPHKIAASSPVLHQQCSVWRNGIKWTTDTSDVLVEVTDHSVVLFLSCRSDVGKKGKELELVNTRAQLMKQILKAKSDFCGVIRTVEEFVPHPQYPVNIPCTSVSVEKIAQAICNGNENVHTSPHHLEPVARLLKFESFQFCIFQSLVDLYCDELGSCKVTSSFVESVSSNITSIDDFCTVLNVPLHKVEVEGGSSDRDKAVRMFQEWQTQPTSVSEDRWTNTVSSQEETYW